MAIRFKQGIKATLDVNKEDLPAVGSGVTYKAAIYNKSMNLRYVANAPTEPVTGILRFEWPHGVTVNGQGKNIPDTSVKNGTASMKCGTYELEIFASDKSFITEGNPKVEVVESNILADNNADASNS